MFPLAYQSVHLYQHQESDSHCSHGLCCTSILPQNGDEQIDDYSEKEHCSICSYHFVVNDLHEVFDYHSQPDCHRLFKLRESTQSTIISIILHKSSRAPPSFLA
jgi:hypothetical protein